MLQFTKNAGNFTHCTGLLNDQSLSSLKFGFTENVGLMGTEMSKTAESAIECPNNLNQTFFDHVFGYPKKV